MLERFLNPHSPSLKICGITRFEDAAAIVAMGVEALGFNFWPQSKRYLAPETAAFLSDLRGKTLRVGVFVNASLDLPQRLFESGLIDCVQLHGDEPSTDIEHLVAANIPVIRALSLSLNKVTTDSPQAATALLLDAHAPGVYGGTGQTIDWQAAAQFVKRVQPKPVILAGGITPDNARDAILEVSPAALDIASGAELSPGVKDLEKVAKLQAALRN